MSQRKGSCEGVLGSLLHLPLTDAVHLLTAWQPPSSTGEEALVLSIQSRMLALGQAAIPLRLGRPQLPHAHPGHLKGVPGPAFVRISTEAGCAGHNLCARTAAQEMGHKPGAGAQLPGPDDSGHADARHALRQPLSLPRLGSAQRAEREACRARCPLVAVRCGTGTKSRLDPACSLNSAACNRCPLNSECGNSRNERLSLSECKSQSLLISHCASTATLPNPSPTHKYNPHPHPNPNPNHIPIEDLLHVTGSLIVGVSMYVLCRTDIRQRSA